MENSYRTEIPRMPETLAAIVKMAARFDGGKPADGKRDSFDVEIR